jgi:hypothetical protein
LCKEDHYCINNNKSICSYISPEEIGTFYKIDNEPNPCREKCYKKFKYCNKCFETGERCTDCLGIAVLLSDGTCYIDPHLINRGSCLIKLHEISDDINTIDLDDFPNKFTLKLENVNLIDHYINKDYTVRVFQHSECTENLLYQVYFKIDSRDAQQKISDEFDSNENLTYSVFITHNFKRHFRYYNHE